MLTQLTKPRGIVVVLIFLAILAWAVWTFWWLPQSDVSNLEPSPTSGGLPVDPD